jgi:hypothetical protein
MELAAEGAAGHSPDFPVMGTTSVFWVRELAPGRNPVRSSTAEETSRGHRNLGSIPRAPMERWPVRSVGKHAPRWEQSVVEYGRREDWPERSAKRRQELPQWVVNAAAHLDLARHWFEKAVPLEEPILDRFEEGAQRAG